MEQNYYIKEIETIVDGIEILSNDSYRLEGKEKKVFHQQAYYKGNTPPAFFGANEGEGGMAQRQQFRQQLIQGIYSNFYVRPLSESRKSTSTESDFLAALSAANQTKEAYDYNWQLYHIDSQGNKFVQKSGELRNLQEGQYVPAQGNLPLKVGQMVHIKTKKEDREIQIPFYYVYSQQLMSQETDLLRFYWNIHPDGAKALVHALTGIFNKYRLPFMFKCLNHPSLYTRADGAVLYIARKDVAMTLSLVPLVYKEVAAFMKEGIPMFSRPLEKGLAFAEDPGKGESFGMHRSTMIADALLHAFDKGLYGQKERKDFVLKAIQAQGMDLEAFYRNPYTHQQYDYTGLQSN